MRGKCMHNMVKLPTKLEKGFTLVELMISLSIGLVLFAGVLSVFVGMRTTTAETSTFGELQENGRFAISVLTNDLLKQNFWGDYSGPIVETNVNVLSPVPGNDCVGGGVNNATFPLAGFGSFRTLWGQTLTAASPDPLGCFSTPASTRTKEGSDVIQIKRVIGNPVPTISLINPLPVTSAGNYYLMANTDGGGIYAHGDAFPVLQNFRTWLYQHHIYYVRERQVGNDFVPVLMQGRLANLTMNFNPVIDGIEVIRFMYGIDTDTNPLAPGYGVINAYISAENMTESLWDNGGGTRVLAVKVYVLARSILPDNKYNNTSSYQLGNLKVTMNDHYRRLLFSSTITLNNASVD